MSTRRSVSGTAMRSDRRPKKVVKILGRFPRNIKGPIEKVVKSSKHAARRTTRTAKGRTCQGHAQQVAQGRKGARQARQRRGRGACAQGRGPAARYARQGPADRTRRVGVFHGHAVRAQEGKEDRSDVLGKRWR